MMFRHTNNVLLAVLAATTAVTFVHAGDGTTCLVTTICDPMEPQLADCTDEKNSSFQACCPPIILTGGDPAAGTGFTCVAFGAAPPTVVAEVPQAVVAPVPAATPAVVAPVPATAVPEPAAVVADPALVVAPVVATDPAVVPETAVADSPTDDPTPGPTPDPTPGLTPDPTPGPTDDPTPGPTPDPTPGPGPTDDGPTEDWQPAVNEATQHAADVTAKYAPDGGDWEQTTSDALANSANDVKNAIQTGADAVDAWNSDSNLVDAPNTAESGTGSSPTVLAVIITLATAVVAAALL
eukprot:CAMPEP_0171002750 /NCGR_PEP_ID=MMETSP0736-20130129/16412_1 /TAXON_ID=186038 /ORGANISM="Fragilariopsis kerguelensis, Strain L26-C5" /LENGTH=294 /DNA_ID=CAMNT_0011431233 /DNA_START=81 /DNA_END=965 /DNA_ORIENTATION=-